MKRDRLLLLALALLALIVMGGAAVIIKLTASEEARKKELAPEARAALERVLVELRAMGIEFHVGETYRSPADQVKQFKAGRSAVAELGWHQLRRAVHLAPKPGGKVDVHGEQLETIRRIHAVAKRHGFDSLAFNADGSKRYIQTSTGKIWDAHHLEFRGGLTLAQARTAHTTGRLV